MRATAPETSAGPVPRGRGLGPEVRARRAGEAVPRGSTPRRTSRRPTAPRATSSRRSPTAPPSISTSPPTSTTRASWPSRAWSTRAASSSMPWGISWCGCRRARRWPWRRSACRRCWSPRRSDRHRQPAARALRPRGRGRPEDPGRLRGGRRTKLVLGENVAQTAQFVQSGRRGRGHHRPVARAGPGDAERGPLLGGAARRLPAAGAGRRHPGARAGTAELPARFRDFLLGAEGTAPPEALRLLPARGSEPWTGRPSR